MRAIVVLLLLFSTLFGEHVIKIAAYNVENLFDLHRSDWEYKEYIPYSKSNWNAKNYHIKLQHIARVIKDMNPDIIALEEIESYSAFQALKKQLNQEGLYYRYSAFANTKDTVVKVGLFSKYKIIAKKEIPVTYSYRYRNILQVKLDIDGKPLYIFVNHWKSKEGKESERIVSAKVLYQAISKLGFDKNIIALGDFNSNYNEYETMKRRNDNTNGITGINNILKTIQTKTNAQEAMQQLCSTCLYNLWYDVPKKERYSYIYKHHHNTLDNIIIDKKLLTDKRFHYIPHSMRSFKEPYLFHDHKIYRWQLTRSRPHRHIGKGYSDHLPVEAEFILKD
jgi:endonuclease/exonuclease/phosphatase family metal-dependent hydrolase